MYLYFTRCAQLGQLFSSEKLNKTHNYFFMNIIPQLHLYQNKNRQPAGKVTLCIFFVSRCAAICINTKNDEVFPQHFAQNNYMSIFNYTHSASFSWTIFRSFCSIKIHPPKLIPATAINNAGIARSSTTKIQIAAIFPVFSTAPLPLQSGQTRTFVPWQR